MPGTLAAVLTTVKSFEIRSFEIRVSLEIRGGLVSAPAGNAARRMPWFRLGAGRLREAYELFDSHSLPAEAGSHTSAECHSRHACITQRPGGCWPRLLFVGGPFSQWMSHAESTVMNTSASSEVDHAWW
jgi:hypothetical protein